MSKSLCILTDEELYHFVKDNDRLAFTELYERYKRPLLVYVLKKVNKQTAEDIVHDLLSKLWINRDNIDVHGRFVGYIFKALRNMVIDHMSRLSHSQRYLHSLDSSAEHHANILTDYKLREESFLINMEQLLNKYSSNAQTIVKLRMQGYHNHEIAKKLNLSEKTVRNQQSAIIKYLKSKFL